MKWSTVVIGVLAAATVVFATMYWTHPREVKVLYPVTQWLPTKPDSVYVLQIKTLTQSNKALRLSLQKEIVKLIASRDSTHMWETELDSTQQQFFRYLAYTFTDTLKSEKSFLQVTPEGTIRSRVTVSSYYPIELIENRVDVVNSNIELIKKQAAAEQKAKFNWKSATEGAAVAVVVTAGAGLLVNLIKK
jgi:hypothetical protein